MSSGNFNQILDQFISIAKFGQSAYKSGERNQESKKQLRKKIASFMSQIDAEKNITLSMTVDEARESIEDYIHDFGNPKNVPDFIFRHLDQTKVYIKILDECKDADGVWLYRNSLMQFTERFIVVSSKILRLAFAEKAPPMTLPSSLDMQIAKPEVKNRYDD